MLEIKSLSKTFFAGSVVAITALEDVNIAISSGDFVVIVGPNGAGKSTLLDTIAGVYSCDAGSIILDGVDITDKPEYERARHIGRVYQDPKQGTAPNMSIEENLSMAYMRGQKRGLGWSVTKHLRNKFYRLLKPLNMGLEHRLKAPVGTLSYGQRQVLALIMGSVKRPDLLLLDEHTAGLDPQSATQVLTVTREITIDSKITTLMITHNMEQALTYGNRLVMMSQGHIVFDVRDENKRALTLAELRGKFREHTFKSTNTIAGI